MKPKRQNKQKDVLFVLISSFVVVVAWIGFNLYHIWATSTINKNIQAQLEPIDPTFDKNTIQSLKTREQVNPLYNRQATASQSASLTSPTPSLSISSSVNTASNASQMASSSGTVSRVGQ